MELCVIILPTSPVDSFSQCRQAYETAAQKKCTGWNGDNRNSTTSEGDKTGIIGVKRENNRVGPSTLIKSYIGDINLTGIRKGQIRKVQIGTFFFSSEPKRPVETARASRCCICGDHIIGAGYLHRPRTCRKITCTGVCIVFVPTKIEKFNFYYIVLRAVIYPIFIKNMRESRA